MLLYLFHTELLASSLIVMCDCWDFSMKKMFYKATMILIYLGDFQKMRGHFLDAKSTKNNNNNNNIKNNKKKN